MLRPKPVWLQSFSFGVWKFAYRQWKPRKLLKKDEGGGLLSNVKFGGSLSSDNGCESVLLLAIKYNNNNIYVRVGQENNMEGGWKREYWCVPIKQFLYTRF